MNLNDVKAKMKALLSDNELELWLVLVEDPGYAGEPLSKLDNKLAFSKEGAIEEALNYIRSIFRRESLKEVNNATVAGLPRGAIVDEIIRSSLEGTQMVIVNGITFHIVETSI